MSIVGSIYLFNICKSFWIHSGETMKILLIHKFHYMLGGTETFHYNLANALTAAAIKSSIFRCMMSAIFHVNKIATLLQT